MVIRTQHRTESEELRAAGESSLRESLTRIDAITDEWFEGLSIRPGSRIAEVNRWTSTHSYSNQLMHVATSATAHVRFLSRYFAATNGSLPTVAGYTPIRASIEASSLGLWLLSGGTLNKRLVRSLKLAWHDSHDLEEWAQLQGIADAKSLRRVEEGLHRDQNARGAVRQFSIEKFPRWTEIVQESEKVVSVKAALTPLAAWKATSAFAHSNMVVVHSFMEHQEVAQDSGRTLLRMSNRVSTFAMFLRVAVVHLETLLSHFEQDSQTHR